VQFGDIDFAPPRPWASLPDNDNQFVVTQRLDVEVGHKLRAFKRPSTSSKNQIKLPVPELLCKRQGVHRIDIEDGRRVLPGKFLDDRLQDRVRNRFRTPDPDLTGGPSFPVLDGLRPGDKKGNERKVAAYRHVLEELGDATLSEIHINDPGEVSVVSASDPLLINLGTADFRSRWIKYLQLKPQIQEQYPQAVRVDLRFKNQVIVKMRDDESSERIVWAGKKNTL